MRTLFYIFVVLFIMAVLNRISPLLMWGVIIIFAGWFIYSLVSMSHERRREPARLNNDVSESSSSYGPDLSDIDMEDCDYSDDYDDSEEEYNMLNPDGQVWDPYTQRWVSDYFPKPRIRVVNDIEADEMTHPRHQHWNDIRQRWEDDIP